MSETHQITEDDESQLSLVCSRHGAHKIVLHCREEMSIMLKCGCSFCLADADPIYEGNFHQGDQLRVFENRGSVLALLGT